MGILVIDGKSVYEIDENCARRRNLPKECGVMEHLQKKDADGRSGRKKGGRNSR